MLFRHFCAVCLLLFKPCYRCKLCTFNVIFAIAANLGAFSFCTVLESVIAGVILCILPEKLTLKLSDLWESGADIAPEGSLRQSLVVRLRFASSALAQVSESVRDVREKSIRFRRLTLMKVKSEWLRQTNFFYFRYARRFGI